MELGKGMALLLTEGSLGRHSPSWNGAKEWRCCSQKDHSEVTHCHGMGQTNGAAAHRRITRMSLTVMKWGKGMALLLTEGSLRRHSPSWNGANEWRCCSLKKQRSHCWMSSRRAPSTNRWMLSCLNRSQRITSSCRPRTVRCVHPR